MMESFLTKAQNAITIPYSLANHPWAQNPAVATDAAIFYAVNPYWKIFEAFIGFCNDPNRLGRMQLSVTSSFSPITIWRVNPYIYCPPSQTNGCFDGLFSGVKIPGSVRPNLDMVDCDMPINFIVTGMEYIDTENIAISVLRSTPELIDVETLQPISKDDNYTHTVTFFLNTVTMQLREGTAWASEVPQAAFTQGQLCPNQRRMPPFGSMISQVISAGIYFIRMPFNIILNGVYIFDRWTQERGDQCPLITRGHSQLLTACGSNALSLKEFFLAAEAANQLLFRSISIVVRAFQDLPGSAMPITFINGVKMFAENTMDPLIIAVVGGDVFKKAFNIPIEKTAMDIFASTLRVPGFMRLFVVIGNPMAWADFVYHFIVDLIYRIIRAVHAPPESRVRPEAIFYLTMYDFKQQFDQIVSASTHRACAGLSLALGYTNPWARIIRTQCDAWASVPSGLLQFVNVFLVDVPAAKCLCKDAQVRVCLLITQGRIRIELTKEQLRIELVSVNPQLADVKLINEQIGNKRVLALLERHSVTISEQIRVNPALATLGRLGKLHFENGCFVL